MPIAFLGGNIGVIFAELAVTIGAAVVFSSILALSLTAMLSSKLLHHEAHDSWLTQQVDAIFEAVQSGYHQALGWCLERPAIIVVCLLLSFGGTYLLSNQLPTTFAPQEDQGTFIAMVSGPEGASFEFMKKQTRQIEDTVLPYVESGDVAQFLLFLPGWGSS